MKEQPRLTLSNGTLEAEIAPHLGARLCRFKAKLRASDADLELLVPLREWDAPEHGCPKAGAYPLIPYSNRIAGARLDFNGTTHALMPHPFDLPNTLHGHTQRRAWTVAEHDSRHAELALREDASENWPWPFEARITFTLRDQTLDVSFSLMNLSTRAMPAGLGWHPFFATDAHTKVHFDARRHWQLDDRFLPTGHTTASQHATTLTPDDWQAADCAIYASEWDGTARIEREEGTLTLKAAPPFTHLVAYAPRGGALCCIEPVSHVANGFNLAARGIEGTGMHVLAPRERFTAHAALTWETKR